MERVDPKNPKTHDKFKLLLGHLVRASDHHLAYTTYSGIYFIS